MITLRDGTKAVQVARDRLLAESEFVAGLAAEFEGDALTMLELPAGMLTPGAAAWLTRQWFGQPLETQYIPPRVATDGDDSDDDLIAVFNLGDYLADTVLLDYAWAAVCRVPAIWHRVPEHLRDLNCDWLKETPIRNVREFNWMNPNVVLRIVRLAQQWGGHWPLDYTDDWPTILVWATNEGHRPVVARLLRDSKQVQAFPPLNWWSVLCRLCEWGATDNVAQLLAISPSVVDPGAHNSYPLCIACEHGHLPLVRLLLANPRVTLSITATDYVDLINPTSAVMAASWNGQLAALECLLEDERVDPSEVDNMALIGAAHGGYLDIVMRLLRHPRVIATIAGNCRILVAACRANRLEVVNYLLGHPAIDTTANHQLAIKTAHESGHDNILARLLANRRVNPRGCPNFKLWLQETAPLSPDLPDVMD